MLFYFEFKTLRKNILQIILFISCFLCCNKQKFKLEIPIYLEMKNLTKEAYIKAVFDFIPIACHYNENSLLTKNGELVQVIQIHGLNSQKISSRLFNLRSLVRQAIKKHALDNRCAFWLHTVRRRTNLDDETKYSKKFCHDLHDGWRKKNYWDDKYVNTLYISVVYDSGIDHQIEKLSNIFSLLGFNKVIKKYEKNFEIAHKSIDHITNSIIAELSEFGSYKLGIKFDNNGTVYSELMFLYKRILHLNETEIPLPTCDLSVTLASHKYAVGNDIIEVRDEKNKNFTSIISIKEYQDVSADLLDNLLQLSIEFIACEIFYFTNSLDMKKYIKEQSYILKVSGAQNLSDIKGFDHIEKIEDTQFCLQQISFAVINNNMQDLITDIANVSNILNKLGIVHIKEDINLEQTFWAQLPGNFRFLRSATPTIIDDTAALASLHNFPAGSKHNPWGQAITLLRTEKGTPYFFNIHDENNQAHMAILGSSNSGKTVLTNFILSESIKYNPTICYFCDNEDSKIFNEILTGEWNNNNRGIINPFLYEKNEENINFVNQFLKIIAGHYTKALSQEALNFIESITHNIFSLEPSQRTLSSLLKSTDFDSLQGGKEVKKRLSIFESKGKYEGLFDTTELLNIKENNINSFNLLEFTGYDYANRYLPEDVKFIPQFELELIDHINVGFGLLFSLIYHYYTIANPQKPNILVIDNIDNLIDFRLFIEHFRFISEKMASKNIAILHNFNLLAINMIGKEKMQELSSIFKSKIIIPPEIPIKELDIMLDLSKTENNRLSSFTEAERMFLVKNESHSIILELSMGKLNHFLKILSANKKSVSIYEKIKKQYQGHPDNWLSHLYDALQK